ncbi:glycosyltransferase family 2 protein [Pseudomonas brenneri]
MGKNIIAFESAPVSEINIVIATYNGARFVADFLASLVEQTRKDFKIIVSDDGSTDETIEIIEMYRCSLNIEIYKNNGVSGVVGNFNSGLQNTTADYVFLADQDDWWAPSKIEVMMDTAYHYEVKGKPLLVFSDIEVVDKDLKSVHQSYYAYSKKISNNLGVQDFVISNHIPGCAMLINKTLAEKAMPFPEGIRMHDWWLAAVAHAIGHVVYVDTPLIKYRQHAGNAVGAPSTKKMQSRLYGLAKSPSSLKKSINMLRQRALWSKNLVQDLIARHGSEMRKADLDNLLYRRGVFSNLKYAFSGKSGEGVVRAIIILGMMGK